MTYSFMNIIKSLLVLSMAISVCIAQGVNISGIVTDTGGTAIAGAAVQLEKGGLPTTTGADGRFTITGTIGIIGQINQPSPNIYIVKIVNSLLYIIILERSEVEIITFTLHGKIISSINRTMDIGTHSIALPHTGAGLYFYKIMAGGNEFVLKSVSIGGTFNKILSTHSSSYTTMSKQIRNYTPLHDVIAVTKGGYLNYRVIVRNSDTSGIEIQMIVCAGTVTDVDGNEYQTVRIGNQVWMAENLRTTKYNDGTAIPLVTDSAAWAALTTPGYCNYSNTTNANIIKKYGSFYNWYVVVLQTQKELLLQVGMFQRIRSGQSWRNTLSLMGITGMEPLIPQPKTR